MDRRDDRDEDRRRGDDPSVGEEGRLASDPLLGGGGDDRPDDEPGVEVGDLGKVSDETERTPGEGGR